jgi:hypothetical protein
MNTPKESMSAAVISDIPTLNSYLYKNRGRLLEETRREMYALATGMTSKNLGNGQTEQRANERSGKQATKKCRPHVSMLPCTIEVRNESKQRRSGSRWYWLSFMVIVHMV